MSYECFILRLSKMDKYYGGLSTSVNCIMKNLFENKIEHIYKSQFNKSETVEKLFLFLKMYFLNGTNGFYFYNNILSIQ